MASAQQSEGRSAPPTWAIIVGVIVVAAVLVGLFLAITGDDEADPGQTAEAQPPEPQDPVLVTEFAGTGDEVTEEFTVEEGWEIRWQTQGESFAIAVTGAQDIGTVVEEDGESGGSTFPAGSGAFQLEVTAEGPWQIEIFDRP